MDKLSERRKVTGEGDFLISDFGLCYLCNRGSGIIKAQNTKS